MRCSRNFRRRTRGIIRDWRRRSNQTFHRTIKRNEVKSSNHLPLPALGKNPYSDLPKSAFWKTGVAQENPYAIEGIYKKKFNIPANAKIVTAGSCFTQHISRHLRKNVYTVLDVEPPPPGLPENLHHNF